jgi:thiamine-monophosphate kinase
MRLPEASELNLITRISRKIRTDSSVICGIGDDTAVLKYTKDRYLLYTCDMLIEGVDFTSRARPEQIGHKALACSLSDIAAMGGAPRYALVSLGIPKRNAQRFVDGFYSGLNVLAGKFKVNVVGGDLSACEKIIVDVSVIGQVRKKCLTLRHGAKSGDIIFVSGSLGGSIYGKHLSFIPRIAEANYLVSHYKASAMMDISDGLSLDLYRLCQASGVGAVIYEDLVPVAAQAKSFDEALHMGEDFELLFTMPVSLARKLIKSRGNIFKAIGEIRDKKFGLKLITRDYQEKPLVLKGYQHF